MVGVAVFKNSVVVDADDGCIRFLFSLMVFCIVFFDLVNVFINVFVVFVRPVDAVGGVIASCVPGRAVIDVLSVVDVDIVTVIFCCCGEFAILRFKRYFHLALKRYGSV